MTWHQRYGSKYGAHSTEYNGVVYHSKKEAQYALELDLRIKAGEVERWERQVRISLDVNGYHICDYYLDFKVWLTDGSVEMVEVKGFETQVWRLKWKLFEALYGRANPEHKLVVVK